MPSEIAERLPKVLIHRNISGEPVHTFLAELDAHWRRFAPVSAYGVRQRFRAAAQAMADEGWPLRESGRWRLGELTVDWAAVAPLGWSPW